MKIFLILKCQIKILRNQFYAIFYKPLCCGTYTTSDEGTSRLHDRKCTMAVQSMDSLPQGTSLRDSNTSIPRAWISASYSRSFTASLCSADWTHMGFFENSKTVLLFFFFFLPCLKTKGISCYPKFLFLPVTKISHEKVKWVQRLHYREMIIWMIHRAVRRY